MDLDAVQAVQMLGQVATDEPANAGDESVQGLFLLARVQVLQPVTATLAAYLIITETRASTSEPAPLQGMGAFEGLTGSSLWPSIAMSYRIRFEREAHCEELHRWLWSNHLDDRLGEPAAAGGGYA